MTASASPLCPACHSPEAAWEIDSPVRALDRVILDPSGLRLLGLVTPNEGLEPIDRPRDPLRGLPRRGSRREPA